MYCIYCRAHKEALTVTGKMKTVSQACAKKLHSELLISNAGLVAQEHRTLYTTKASWYSRTMGAALWLPSGVDASRHFPSAPS